MDIKSIQDYIKKNARQEILNRAEEIDVTIDEKHKDKILATALGTRYYSVVVWFKDGKVTDTHCNCPYDHGGICKHIASTLFKIGKVDKEKYVEKKEPTNGSALTEKFIISKFDHQIILENIAIKDLEEGKIKKDEIKAFHAKLRTFRATDIEFDENNGLEMRVLEDWRFQSTVKMDYQFERKTLHLTCSCRSKVKALCAHEAFALAIFHEKTELHLLLNPNKRDELLEDYAKKIGFQPLDRVSDFFEIRSDGYGKLNVVKKNKNLMLLDKNTLSSILNKLPTGPQLAKKKKVSSEEQIVLCLQEDYLKEYRPYFQFYKCPLSKAGTIKNPITVFPKSEAFTISDSKEYITFWTAVEELQELINQREMPFAHLVELVKKIAVNPENLAVYLVETSSNGKISTSNMQLVKLDARPFELIVKIEDDHHLKKLTAFMKIDDKEIPLEKAALFSKYFIRHLESLYVIPNEYIQRLLLLFENYNFKIMITALQFETLERDFLQKFNGAVQFRYKNIPTKILSTKEKSTLKKKIYLSESEDFILVTPVIVYPDREIPILSQESIYVADANGQKTEVLRDFEVERELLELVESSHEDFSTQQMMTYFYMHANHFFNLEWFLEVFENWNKKEVEVLGFNTLKRNRYSPHKMKISVQAKSEMNWFQGSFNVTLGQQQLRLKDIQKAVYNNSKYVELKDGTLGYIPKEWFNRFEKMFRVAELKDDTLMMPKSRFAFIDELFDQREMTDEMRLDVENFQQKLKAFKQDFNPHVPKTLKAKLRDYQLHGLNWLRFLDEFEFGGCLADDMGLGKTIQIITFILDLKERNKKRQHLIVLPTTLLFNWQQELKKFAPSLTYHVLHGNARDVKAVQFDKYDLIFTTYGTLMSDIETLKKVKFDYVILDESQAIKNPESKRYKSVRLLQARNRIVMTGTPIENNTFDLYAQLSFAHPGLLGNMKYFRDVYSGPIDRFQDRKRAKELQQLISPFILRRTKKQVATELPDKTEMVIYCEMGTEQRKVYEAYRREFELFLEKSSDEELSNNSMHVLQGLTKLRQICNSPMLLSDEASYGNESVKLDELMEQIDGLKANHKVLVFSQFVEMLNLIKERLEKENVGYSLLTGQSRNRQEIVEEFQNEDDKRVFLISLKAGGTGLNLTEADYVFIVDPWWNPAVESQAIDRAYRIGQQKHVTAIKMICKDTIEEKIMDLQETKKNLADDLIRIDRKEGKNISKKDLLGLLGR